MNPVLRLTHYIVTRDEPVVETLRFMAHKALAEHDRLRLRVSELERENKVLKDPRDRVMTELA